MKSLCIVLNFRYRVRTHVLASALGSSTKTVWSWIVNNRGIEGGCSGGERGLLGLHGRRFRRKKYLPRSFPVHVLRAFLRLAAWLNFKEKFGWMASIDDIADGVEPP